MYRYGKPLYRVSPESLKSYIPETSTDRLRIFRLYLALFGFPDVSGAMRFDLFSRYFKLMPGMKVLDIGCGLGLYLKYLSEFPEVTAIGIDLNLRNVRRVRAICNANVSIMSASGLGFS